MLAQALTHIGIRKMHESNVKLASVAAHHLANVIEEKRDGILALAELENAKEGLVEIVQLLLCSDKLAEFGGCLLGMLDRLPESVSEAIAPRIPAHHSELQMLFD